VPLYDEEIEWLSLMKTNISINNFYTLILLINHRSEAMSTFSFKRTNVYYVRSNDFVRVLYKSLFLDTNFLFSLNLVHMD